MSKEKDSNGAGEKKNVFLNRQSEAIADGGIGSEVVDKNPMIDLDIQREGGTNYFRFNFMVNGEKKVVIMGSKAIYWDLYNYLHSGH